MGKLARKIKKRAAVREKIPTRTILKTLCPECGQMMEVKDTIPHMVVGYCENCNKSFHGMIEKIPESTRHKLQRQLKSVPGSAGGKCTNTIIRWHNWEDGENDGEGDKGES